MKKSIVVSALFFALILFLPGFVFSESAEIVIDDNRSPGQVNPFVWGTNLVSDSDSGEGVWNTKKNTPNQEMLEMTKNAGIRFLRFPGGCIAHLYKWRKGIGPSGSRPETVSIWRHKTRNSFGTAEFITFCRKAGAEPVITVSYFAGGPQEAADWVEYCNGSADTTPLGALRAKHGYPEPFDVKYWEIGNEVWHGYAVPHNNLSLYVVSPSNYARRFKQYCTAMKTKDPSIQCGAVGCEMGLRGFDSFCMYWNKNVMEIAGQEIDFFSLHTYLPGYHPNLSSKPVDHFRALMAGANQSEQSIYELQRLWQNLSGKPENSKFLKSAFTEFHAGFMSKERFSWGGALYTADMLMVMQNPENRVIGANYMEHSNGFWGMFKGFGQVHKRPDALIFELTSKNIGKRILSVKVSCKTFDPPDIGYVHSSETLVAAMNTLQKNNLLIDADFEAGSFNGAWKTRPVKGASVHIDSNIRHIGQNSARVEFKGTKDLNFLNLFQTVDLIPGKAYCLSGYVRTENIKADKGVSIALMDAVDYKIFNITTQQLSGNNDWTWVGKTFRLSAKTKKVYIMLRRFKGGGKISGKAWFDNVSLVEYQPRIIKETPVMAAFATSSDNGKNLFLWVINRDPFVSFDTKVLIKNMQSKYSRYTVLTMTGKGKGKKSLFSNNVSIADTAKSFSGKVLMHKFPPASLTIFKFME